MYYPIRAMRNAVKHSNEEYLSIGPTPFNEKCIQAGGDCKAAILECQVFIEQLKRNYGNPPEGSYFFILKNYHDFGVYYEAAVMYDMNNEVAINYALQIENGPGSWDTISLKTLQKYAHPLHACIKQ